MSHKTKKLTLSYPYHKGLPDQGKYFLVTKAIHSTEYLPGAVLDKAQVDDLNDNKLWEVTIVPAK